MFCSKCGKDCGEFRFCPDCGTKIYWPDQETNESNVPGTPCKKCGCTLRVGKYCAFCGERLLFNQVSENVSVNDHSVYFYRYYPDRIDAIKALRKDTGMGLTEAKRVIDQMFDEKMGISQDKTPSNAKKKLVESIRNIFKRYKA